MYWTTQEVERRSYLLLSIWDLEQSVGPQRKKILHFQFKSKGISRDTIPTTKHSVTRDAVSSHTQYKVEIFTISIMLKAFGHFATRYIGICTDSNKMENFQDRTSKALGIKLIKELEKTRFCIVGCGGTGANFAELLVRSGAKNITLIDGGEVKESDLNRICAFTVEDAKARKNKAQALAKRLQQITEYEVNIRIIPENFVGKERRFEERKTLVEAYQAIHHHTTDIVFIGVDNNQARIEIEETSIEKRSLSCGVFVGEQDGEIGFECAWQPKTPLHRRQDEGYGDGNPSYGAIVIEAACVAFHMLLNHLDGSDNELNAYSKTYSREFVPIKVEINGKPIYR